MSKLTDSSAIKLFGQTIPLLTLNQKEALADHELSSRGAVNSNGGVQVLAPMEDQGPIAEVLQDKHEGNTDKEIREDSLVKSSKNEETSDQTTSSQDKTLKKPDKVLPCPRCNSKETKFCYYNNYNVNQPRHFCKNCQRYWTAGGTMRNLPVGAGRRKTKTSSSSLHYHQIMISEAIKAVQASSVNFLAFGSDPSIASPVWDISGKAQIHVQNGIHRPDNLSGESVITAEDKNCQWIPSKLPCFPRPFPWDSIQWNTATVPPLGFPVSFNPTPTYISSVPSPWGVPMASTSPSFLNHSGPSSRKHSRDEEDNLSPANMEKQNDPKTLRIDDPGETAQSIMLATLVNKTKKLTGSVNSGGLFDGFQWKTCDDERNYRVESLSSVLQANPAALSRSLNFHENT
ncbi:hypothetical protein PTKIN_Ptkin02bG0016000 [Pterospermum kingtungense]